MEENRFWDIIDKLGWGTKSLDCRFLGRELLPYIYNVDEIAEMRKMTVYFRSKLHPHYNGSDSMWDLTAHIVGLGKEFYNQTLKDLKQVEKYYNNYHFYKENFEYIFGEATNLSKTEEGRKLIGTKCRDRKLKRILGI